MVIAEEKQYRLAVGTLAAFALGYAWLLFAQVGSDSFFDFHTAFLPFLLALIAWLETISMIHLSRQTSTERVWRHFSVGMALWTLAEGIWLYYDYWQEIPLPYPSISDVFWALGYVPIIVGFWWQYQSLNVSVTMPRRIVLGLWTAVLLVVGAFFVHPLLAVANSGGIAPFFLDVVYMLLDIALLTALFWLVLALRGGKLAGAWRWMAFGFALLAASDVMFSVLTWHGLYYPEGETNFWSMATDYVYVMSYALAVLGLYRYRQIYHGVYQVAPAVLAREETGPLQVQNRIIIFTDPYDRIISASPVLADLLGLDTAAAVEGRLLREVLPGLERVEKRLHQERFISEMLVTLRSGSGEAIPARVSALGMYDKEHWQGANILIGLLVSLGVEDRMNTEFQSMADYIAAQSGLLQQEQQQVAAEYLSRVCSAFRAAIQEGKGPTVAEAFSRQLAEALREEGFAVDEVDGRLRLSTRMAVDEYRRGVRFAVQTARDLAADLIGRGAAYDVLRQVHGLLQGRMREVLQQQGLLQEE